MLKVIFFLFLFLNPTYSHELSSEYSEFKNEVSYELMANNHKKNKSGKKKNKEEKRSKKKQKEWIEYKYPKLRSDCLECQNLNGFISPSTIDLEIFRMAGIIPGRPTSKDVKIQKKKRYD